MQCPTTEERDDAHVARLREGLHPLERRVLALFGVTPALSEDEIGGRDPSLNAAQISMAIGWLLAKGVIAQTGEREDVFVSLTETGLHYAQRRHPVLRIADDLLHRGPIAVREIQQRADMEAEEKSAAVGFLKESGAARVAQGGLLEIADASQLTGVECLQQLIQRMGNQTRAWATLAPDEQEAISSHHRKRSKAKGIFRVDTRRVRAFAVTPIFGPLRAQMDVSDPAEEWGGGVTPEMLKTGAWQGRTFRKYNIQLPAPRVSGGQTHPYKNFLDTVKWKFVAMGFVQMRGPLVESEFWNMDALYMPQFHPARAIHDVYFVKDSPLDKTIPEDVIARVAATHQTGGTTGSRGWRYPFDAQRTRRRILRSQGTAVSARTLGALPRVPGKYFSIARCFRYDAVDATHAPDFFQVEGIVLGQEIRFTTLLGLLTLFAKEIAHAQDVRFLPAYFPFTEPSVEMHARHPQLGWMELGGAGLFRPEVTEPLGVDVPVIAWGLGLDRMAMVALGISDIRALFSPDLDFIRACGSADGSPASGGRRRASAGAGGFSKPQRGANVGVTH